MDSIKRQIEELEKIRKEAIDNSCNNSLFNMFTYRITPYGVDEIDYRIMVLRSQLNRFQ